MCRASVPIYISTRQRRPNREDANLAQHNARPKCVTYAGQAWRSTSPCGNTGIARLRTLFATQANWSTCPRRLVPRHQSFRVALSPCRYHPTPRPRRREPVPWPRSEGPRRKKGAQRTGDHRPGTSACSSCRPAARHRLLCSKSSASAVASCAAESSG